MTARSKKRLRSFNLFAHAAQAREAARKARKAKTLAKRGKGKKRSRVLSLEAAKVRTANAKLKALRSEAIATLKAARAELVKMRRAAKTLVEKYRGALDAARKAALRFEAIATDYVPTIDDDALTLEGELDEAIAGQIEIVEGYVEGVEGE